MSGANSNEMTVGGAINRGYNMLAATLFGLTGLTFGSEIFGEVDPIDKVDNTLLAIIGVVAVVWYFTGRRWELRSPIPIVLAGAALVVQIFGFAVEIGDAAAIGDDIPGLIIFVSSLIVLAVVYSINGELLSAANRTAG